MITQTMRPNTWIRLASAARTTSTDRTVELIAENRRLKAILDGTAQPPKKKGLAGRIKFGSGQPVTMGGATDDLDEFFDDMQQRERKGFASKIKMR